MKSRLHQNAGERRFGWPHGLAEDLRYGVRSLRRTPTFTAAALLTLALAIGANAAVFSVVNGVILRPLDYPQPDRLMYLSAASPFLGAASGAMSTPEYIELRDLTQSFKGVGAYTTGEVNLTAADRPLRVRSVSVDAHLLTTLGIEPAHGRLFRAEETAQWTGTLSPAIAILSHELWQTAFGGRALVGTTVDVDGRPHEILGVMPPAADVMDNRTDIWLPLWVHPIAARQRAAHALFVIARLKDGVDAQTAQGDLNRLLANWAERAATDEHAPTDRPSRPADHTVRMQPLQSAIVGSASRAVLMLQAAVGFLLLIACANLANLVIAHTQSRRREFAVRTALGASRGRLLRQTVTEGLLVSAAGGILGTVFAQAALQALIRIYPATLPRTSEIAVDVVVLLVALGLSACTAVLFGVAPMKYRQMTGLIPALKDGGDQGALGGGRHRIRRTLVIAELALSVMLVVCAGLLIRTAYNLSQVDPGFDRSRMVTFSMSLPMATSEPETRALAYQRLLDRLRVTPGIERAAVMSGLPPHRSPEAVATRIDSYIAADGRPVEAIDYYQFVMGDYFETMGIPIVAGRGFDQNDAVPNQRGVVVNETLAKNVWKGQNPIGQRLRPNVGSTLGAGDGSWHTVIGVARDVKQHGLDRAAGSELYVSLDQQLVAPATMNVVLKTTLPETALYATLERLVRAVDPTVPIVRLRNMDAVFAESMSRPRLLAQLLGAFAALALILAAVGTYGVLSHIVTERRREIGVRMALGAARASVLAMVMKQGFILTTTSLVIGLAGAIAANRLIATLLFGVEPTDMTTLIGVVATIAVVATVAGWLPAWRASRLNPSAILRGE